MPYNMALIKGCTEYKIGYEAAYPLLLKAARALAQSTPAELAAEVLKNDASLRLTVTTAMEAASPAQLGPRGRYAQGIAYEHALAYAAERGYSQTDFGGLSSAGVIG